MTRTFIQTREFSSNWDRLGFDDEDLRKLEFNIMSNYDKYPVIKGTGGLRKARYARRDRGKRGGVRVCYVDFVMEETIYLITVYPKNEKDNLSHNERNEIKKMIMLLESSLKKGGGYNE